MENTQPIFGVLIKAHLIVDFHALEVVCPYFSFLEHQWLQPPIHHFSTPTWPTRQSSQ